MKTLVLFAALFLIKDFIESTKTYRLSSLNSCKGNNDDIAEITKCEIDGQYFTINIHNKAVFAKIYVDFKLELMNSDNKVILKDSLPTFDWCGLFGRNGKVPTSIGWKVLMKGFGKNFKDYMNCPIRKNFTLNRIHGDPKMLLFVPNGKGFLQFSINAISDKGQKVIVNVSITAEVIDI